MNPNKTQGIHDLVAEVLKEFHGRYGEDIIEDVFVKIEGNKDWQKRYDQLCDERGKHVVNSWTGIYTKELTGLNTLREVPAKRTRLIQDYTKLTR